MPEEPQNAADEANAGVTYRQPSVSIEPSASPCQALITVASADETEDGLCLASLS